MSAEQIIEADWTWVGGAFRPGIKIGVDESGRITSVGESSRAPTLRLDRRAMLPGMINVHSHAFQRGLRGHGERFPAGAGSFWTWRQAMYALVDSLDADRIYELSLQAFKEMLASGITTVGEFHYVHHDASLQGFALDECVIRAAHDAGIRMVLLYTYYNTGGVGKPLEGGQRRFRCDTPADYWRQFDRVAGLLASDRQSMGAVVHSVRAAGIDDLVAVHKESVRRQLVFHIHVEEQRKEVEDCVAAYGVNPMALVNARLAVDSRFTAVHCTHTADADMKRYVAAGGNVCRCPTTEGNLGDGIADVSTILSNGGRICFGTDSNSRLCMAEEMRWLEYAQRLYGERRGVVVDGAGNVAAALLTAATENGAHALALPSGRIESGCLADLMSLDLDAPSIAGWTPETLLDAWVFGAGNDVVADVCVGGQWLHRR